MLLRLCTLLVLIWFLSVFFIFFILFSVYRLFNVFLSFTLFLRVKFWFLPLSLWFLDFFVGKALFLSCSGFFLHLVSLLFFIVRCWHPLSLVCKLWFLFGKADYIDWLWRPKFQFSFYPHISLVCEQDTVNILPRLTFIILYV